MTKHDGKGYYVPKWVVGVVAVGALLYFILPLLGGINLQSTDASLGVLTKTQEKEQLEQLRKLSYSEEVQQNLVLLSSTSITTLEKDWTPINIGDRQGIGKITMNGVQTISLGDGIYVENIKISEMDDLEKGSIFYISGSVVNTGQYKALGGLRVMMLEDNSRQVAIGRIGIKSIENPEYFYVVALKTNQKLEFRIPMFALSSSNVDREKTLEISPGYGYGETFK